MVRVTVNARAKVRVTVNARALVKVRLRLGLRLGLV